MKSDERFTLENTIHFPDKLLLELKYNYNGVRKGYKIEVNKSDLIGKTQDEFLAESTHRIERIKFMEEFAKIDTMKYDAQMESTDIKPADRGGN